jgi:predicted amidophosphoribosyltransferase
MSEYLCPHCKKPVYDDEALLCLYCGESLNRSIGLLGKMKYTRPKIIITAIVLLVLLSFALLMIK